MGGDPLSSSPASGTASPVTADRGRLAAGRTAGRTEEVQVLELRRQHRVMAWIRGLGAPFAAVQVLTFYRDYPAGFEAVGLALAGVLAVVAAVVLTGARLATTTRGLQVWAVIGLAADVLLVMAFVLLHTFDPETAVWAMIYLIPLEGAVLFQLRGALTAYAAVAAGYVAREWIGAQHYGFEFLWTSLSFRLGLGLMMAVVMGLTAQGLVRERDRLRILSDALQRRGEELQAANSALESARRSQMEFVSVTNHELRTPLTAIKGFAVTLSHRWDDMDDEVKRSAVAAIEQQSRRLDELVADLLTVSSMRSGSLALTPRRLVLVEWLGQAAVISDVLATIHCEPDVEVHADATRLLQILCNLLTNARKYGDPPIVMTGTSDGRRTVIEVIDHGPGVPEPFVPHMWEEFTQASVGDTRTAEGPGLGLAIVKYLVTALDGTVAYRPRGGGGSVFTVDLPTVPAEGEGLRVDHAQAAARTRAWNDRWRASPQ
jgi:signal transduction histidine kinase